MPNFLKEKRKPIIKLAVILIILAAIYFLFIVAQKDDAVRDTLFNLGYPGVFLIALVSGFNLLVPIPAVSFTPIFVEAGLNIWLLIFFIVLGTSIADSIAYAIGRVSRELAGSWIQEKLVKQLDRLKSKYYLGPLIALFLFAALAPLPNELILVPIGLMGYKFRYVFIPYLVGNTIFNTLVAFGITNIFNK